MCVCGERMRKWVKVCTYEYSMCERECACVKNSTATTEEQMHLACDCEESSTKLELDAPSPFAGYRVRCACARDPYERPAWPTWERTRSNLRRTCQTLNDLTSLTLLDSIGSNEHYYCSMPSTHLLEHLHGVDVALLRRRDLAHLEHLQQPTVDQITLQPKTRPKRVLYSTAKWIQMRCSKRARAPCRSRLCPERSGARSRSARLATCAWPCRLLKAARSNARARSRLRTTWSVPWKLMEANENRVEILTKEL